MKNWKLLALILAPWLLFAGCSPGHDSLPEEVPSPAESSLSASAGEADRSLPSAAQSPSESLPAAEGPPAASAVDAVSAAPPVPPEARVQEYEAERPKSVVELQKFRQNRSLDLEDPTGRRVEVTLTNLNPRINTWFLLRLRWAEGEESDFHLENRDSRAQRIGLDPAYPGGLVIEKGTQRFPCNLWGTEASPLRAPWNSKQPYIPLCQERLYLRNPTQGHKTSMEWATDFLRDYVWGGEQITVFVRQNFYQDAYLKTSEVIEAESAGVGGERVQPPGAPLPARISPRYEDHYLVPLELGITRGNEAKEKLRVGRWYPARGIPGVFVSAIEPRLVSEEVVEAQKGQVNPLDDVEARALVYLVAFDLDQFQLGFALGTEHPRVDWSDRVLPTVRIPSLPGPDGIGSIRPLVSTGMVRPADVPRTAATFTGGFKRYHGAFRRGDFAVQNRGSHYGFLEQGVVLSKLHPGLATVVVYDDDRVELKTWSEEDEANLARIRHARQNGVPLIEFDPTTRTSKPGYYVSRPSLGNWSGSVDGRYRTLRAGLCLQEEEDRRFLIYGYFSSATPSSMARVFQAYGCKYAMLTDMNALEHTYLALYRRQDSQLQVEHLIREMRVLDKSSNGQVIPRFIGYADNRDFFYLLRKGGEP